MTKHSKSLTLNLRERNEHRGMKNLGTFTVNAEETMASRTVVELVFRCSDLDNKDLFSKSVCTFLQAVWLRSYCVQLMHKILPSFFYLRAGSFFENI